MNRQQALAALSEAYDSKGVDFGSTRSGSKLSITKAAEHLIGKHRVPEHTAYDWAIDWAARVEKAEAELEEPRIVGYHY